MRYSNRNWECPFFKWDEKKGQRILVHCEGGRIALPAGEMSVYAAGHCGSLEGWKVCSLAQALLRHYEDGGPGR